MGEADHYIENSPNKYDIMFALFSGAFFVSIGAIAFSLSTDWDTRLFASVALIAAFLLSGGAILWRQYVVYPKGVFVGDPCTAVFRLNGPREIPLESIDWVSSQLGDQSTLTGRMNSGGSVKIRGDRRSLHVRYEVAHAIQEEYAKEFGKYPPSRPDTNGDTN